MQMSFTGKLHNPKDRSPNCIHVTDIPDGPLVYAADHTLAICARPCIKHRLEHMLCCGGLPARCNQLTRLLLVIHLIRLLLSTACSAERWQLGFQLSQSVCASLSPMITYNMCEWRAEGWCSEQRTNLYAIVLPLIMSFWPQLHTGFYW